MKNYGDLGGFYLPHQSITVLTYPWQFALARRFLARRLFFLDASPSHNLKNLYFCHDTLLYSKGTIVKMAL